MSRGYGHSVFLFGIIVIEGEEKCREYVTGAARYWGILPFVSTR